MLRGLRSIRPSAEQEAAACRRHDGTEPVEKVTTCHPSALSDGLPIFVGEVEIGVTVVFSDSDVNRALRGVKLGARLKQIERRPDCLRARGVAGLLIDRRRNQCRNCLLRMGQVSRWPSIARSAKAAPLGS
jgi:hypothetical protein